VIEAATEAAAGGKIAAGTAAGTASATAADAQAGACSIAQLASLTRSERTDSARSDAPFPPVFHGSLGSSGQGSGGEDAQGAQDDLASEVRSLIHRLHAVERTLQQQQRQQEADRR